jgi:hypothetical protein
MTGFELGIARMRSVRAVIELGRRRASKGDQAGAAEAFLLAAKSPDSRYNLRGALHLWILRSEAGDPQAADEAYLLAADLDSQNNRGESTAGKSLGLGCHIASRWREFVQPARLAFHRSISSGGQESVPLAAMGLAGL